MSTGSLSLGLRFSPLERGGLVVFVVVFDSFNLCKSFMFHNSYLIINFVLAYGIEMFPINAGSVCKLS